MILSFAGAGCVENKKKEDKSKRLTSFLGVSLGMNLEEVENVLGESEPTSTEHVYVFENNISVAFSETGETLAVITNNPAFKVMDIPIGDPYDDVLKQLGLPNKRISYTAGSSLIFCSWNKYNIAISFYQRTARTIGIFNADNPMISNLL